MKVCYIGREYYPKNASSIRPVKLSSSGDKSIEIHLLLPDILENRNFQKEMLGKIDIILVKAGYFEFLHKFRALRKGNYDYIHILNIGLNTVLPIFLNWLYFNNSKNVVELDEWKSEMPGSRIKKKYFDFLTRLAIALSESVVVSSAYLKKRLLDKGYKKVHYIPYGIDLAQKGKNGKSKENENFTIAYLGTYQDYFDLDILVEVFPALMDEFPNIEFLFFGDGPKRSLMEKKLNYDNVCFKGFIKENDIFNELSKADAFFLPLKDNVLNRSRCPNKINYYLLFDRPIITNPVGEVGALLGDKGCYFNFENPTTLINTFKEANGKTFNYKSILDSRNWEKLFLKYKNEIWLP